MHKGIILLTKASTIDKALTKTRAFLEVNMGEEFDWYMIGG